MRASSFHSKSMLIWAIAILDRHAQSITNIIQLAVENSLNQGKGHSVA
ncbi:MAG: hypothetical protein AAF327_25265 [Cyanobacteria bacterium P01_A01_bin.37]